MLQKHYDLWFKRLSHRKQAFLKVYFYRCNNIEKAKNKIQGNTKTL